MAVDIRQAKKILLEVVPKTKIVPMLWGARGLGKSQLADEVACELGYSLAVLRIGQMEVGDLIGLPLIVDGHTAWARPCWWPQDEAQPTIVFLDELNRVTERSVVDAIMQFVLDRRLHTHVLAEQHRIVCAGNPPSDGYNVSDLDDAAMSRLMHLYIENSVESWMAWADGKISRDIMDFIATNQNLLAPPDSGESVIHVQPNHRAYQMLNEIYTNCDLDETLLYYAASGIIGKEAAVVFRKFLKERYSRPVSARDVLGGYEKVRDKVLAQKDRQDLINATVTDLVAYLSVPERAFELDDKQKMNNFVAFIRDLPRDLAVSLVSALIKHEHLKFPLSKHDGLYDFLRIAVKRNIEEAV